MNKHQIGAQLYTVRDLCKTPGELRETLQNIRAIGYEIVEVAGICEIDAKELRAMCRDAGLQVCSIHGKNLLETPDIAAENAEILGCDYVVYSYPSGFDVSQKQDVDVMVSKLQKAGEKLSELNKTLCYHHHSLEFCRYENKTVLQHLVDVTNPEQIHFELDTYWIQHGGGNPVEWCEKLKGRLPVLHLKDYGNIKGTPTMMEVGNGNLNWEGILQSSRSAGCKWWVVEQDVCPESPLKSLSISYENISKLSLK